MYLHVFEVRGKKMFLRVFEVKVLLLIFYFSLLLVFPKGLRCLKTTILPTFVPFKKKTLKEKSCNYTSFLNI